MFIRFYFSQFVLESNVEFEKLKNKLNQKPIEYILRQSYQIDPNSLPLLKNCDICLTNCCFQLGD